MTSVSTGMNVMTQDCFPAARQMRDIEDMVYE